MQMLRCVLLYIMKLTISFIPSFWPQIDLTSTLGTAPSTTSMTSPAYSTPAVPPPASAGTATAYPPQRLRAISLPPAASAYAVPPHAAAAALPKVPPSMPLAQMPAQPAPHSAAAAFQAPATPPSAVAAAGPASAATASSEPLMLFEGDSQLPPGLRNFPCALRNFKKAQVTTTCEIDCGDASCSKAKAACAQYVECHALVVRASSSSSSSSASLASASAVLKTDTSRSKDDSLVRLQQSPWWGSPALQHGRAPRPRVYVVASYGGSGSKMLSG